MIDPATGWFGIVELLMVEAPTGFKEELIVTEDILHKTSKQTAG